MSKYLENLDEKTKQYFQILSNEFPDFLEDYINTPEMQKQSGISISCGTFYSKMFDNIWYSSLEHSVGVALIVWKFTKDKKQTLAGLFHDIATPVFKHCIDFINGDYETQESTEELTTEIKESDNLINNKYCVNIDKVKIRYINPLVNVGEKYVRIADISNVANKDIERALSFKTKNIFIWKGCKNEVVF